MTVLAGVLRIQCYNFLVFEQRCAYDQPPVTCTDKSFIFPLFFCLMYVCLAVRLNQYIVCSILDVAYSEVLSGGF